MKIQDLVKLVKSLSAAEKRTFRRQCDKSTGNKYYLDLFNMIEQVNPSSSLEDLEKAYRKEHSGKHLENAINYLLKLIIDTLVHIRKETDRWFQQNHSLMRAKILMERSLNREGYKEIEKAKKISQELQDNLVHTHICKLDLEYLSEQGFPDMTEQQLVQMQTQVKNGLRLQQKIQDQSALLDILKLRGLKKGKSLSTEDSKKLNDLLLSELSLVTRDLKDNFESRKLHLLFQSFFLTHVNESKSSLKSFYDLNLLFEENENVWSYPPYDYLQTLEGILNNLRTLRYYQEMEFYIQKVEQLSNSNYPENFLASAMQTTYVYRLISLIRTGQLNEAKAIAANIPPELLSKPQMVNYEKVTELLFETALLSFLESNYTRAIKTINVIVNIYNINTAVILTKAARLLKILAHYELQDIEFLEYEIRSYKRTFYVRNIFETEKIFFKWIKFDPKTKNQVIKEKFWSRIAPVCDQINNSIYEVQFLKHFDFLAWIKSRTTKE